MSYFPWVSMSSDTIDGDGKRPVETPAPEGPRGVSSTDSAGAGGGTSTPVAALLDGSGGPAEDDAAGDSEGEGGETFETFETIDIDDLELIEEDDLELEEDDSSPAALSRPQPHRPLSGTRPAPPPAPPKIPTGPRRPLPPTPRDASGPLTSLSSGAVGDPFAVSVTGPHAAVVDTIGPPEMELDQPTVVDRAVERLGEGIWRDRAEELETRLEAATDDRDVAALAYELGELHERQLDDEASAVTAYNRALHADPSLRPNLWAIRRVFYRRHLWPNLVRLIDAEVQFAASDDERASLLVEKGQILQYRIGELAEARGCYDQAVALETGQSDSSQAGTASGANGAGVRALMQLERLALADDDEAELERVWSLALEVAIEPRRKLVFALDLIKLYIQRGDLDHAQDMVAEAIALGVGLDRVARERQRIAETSDDVSGVVAALEARALHLKSQYAHSGAFPVDGGDAAPEDAAINADHAHVLRLRVVDLHRAQARALLDQVSPDTALDADEDARGMVVRARGYLEKARVLAPAEPLLIADLAAVAERMGDHRAVADLHGAWGEVESDPARALALALRRADGLLRAGDRNEARALMDSLATIAPGYLPLTGLRERDALEHRDWAALAVAFSELATAVTSDSVFDAVAVSGGEGPGDDGRSASGAADPMAASRWAAGCLVNASDLYAERLELPTSAIACLRRALEICPGYEPAVIALCDLHERTGQMADAIDLLEGTLDGADPSRPETRAALGRLSWLYRQLGDLDKAVATDQRILDGDPPGPARIRLYWRMEAALGALGRSKERAETLLALADALDLPVRRGTALYDAARIYENDLGDPSRAAELYRKVLEVWPGDRYARAALTELLREAGKWQELVAERRREAAELADGPALISALREAAAILADDLGERDAASEVYRELLERVPGDPGTLRDLARLHAQNQRTPESPGFAVAADSVEVLIDALEQESVADSPPRAQAAAALRLAMVRESLGQRHEALDAYRRAADLDRQSTLPAVAIAELALALDDEMVYLEGLEMIAERSNDAGLTSEILEDVGWTWAFAMGDEDRALEAFERAAVAQPTRAGARLGLALVRAKQGDREAQGEALSDFSETVQSPDAAAALLLRAATLAEVGGDTELLHDRLHRALERSPDESTLIVAAEYATALRPEEAELTTAEQFVARAELFGMRAAMAANPATRVDWELDQAEALEAAGRLRDAAHIVTRVLGNNLDDVRALQLLRRLCRRGGDRASLARASLSLARVLADPSSKLTLWREAARILDVELGDGTTAVPVYRRILTEEPGAEEYDRLVELCRENGDVRALFEILSDRLNWLDIECRAGAAEPAAQIPLLFERAQLRQRIADSRGTVRDLSQLLAIDDSHAGALQVQAEAFLAAGNSERAVELYQRFLEVERDPARRAEVELALSQILAEDMDDIAGAIEQLEHVVASSPGDLALRERLVNLLVKGMSWSRAVDQLEALAPLRQSDAERAQDQQRIAAIYRDRLNDRDGARSALERAREIAPLDADTVRELAELLLDDEAARTAVLDSAIRDIRAAITERPAEAGLYQRLGVVHNWRGDPDGEYYALCAARALGSLSAEKSELVSQHAARVSQFTGLSDRFTEARWSALSAIDDDGTRAAGEIWRALQEAIDKIGNLDAGKQGFARGDKLSMRNLARRFQRLAAAIQAFSIDIGEVYVSAAKSGYIRVLSGAARPTLLLGEDMAALDTPRQRFAFGRAMVQARLGTGAMIDLREDDVAMFFAAAARLAGRASLPAALASVVAAQPDEVEEHGRALQKYIGRRDRKTLSSLAARFDDIGTGAGWRRAALRTGARAGLLLAGDAAVALDAFTAGRAGGALVDDSDAVDLLVWMVSTDHHELRRSIGLGGLAG